MKVDLSKIQSYGIEGMVILFSVILSFYVEGQRDLSEKNDKIILNKITKDSIEYFLKYSIKLIIICWIFRILHKFELVCNFPQYHLKVLCTYFPTV